MEKFSAEEAYCTNPLTLRWRISRRAKEVIRETRVKDVLTKFVEKSKYQVQRVSTENEKKKATAGD